ncbi:MAG TPA: hypothetical protein VLA43_20510, partial [Longimicrobiales bacterium]|nr:hypothetical protein [Longimicrobiales bacterium]
MRVVPERSPWALIATTLVLMCAGPVVGLALAVFLAPDSDVVQVLSPLAFGVTFVGGLFLWMGVGIVAVVGRFFVLLARGRLRAEAPKRTERLVPPGYRIFPVLGGVLGLGMGLLAGLLTPLTVMVAAGAWTAAGAAYGWVLRQAAHEG